MIDVREFERWMRTAQANLRSAKGDLERGDYNWACFKAQQAAEMAVKALLYGIGRPAHGHSVSKLLQRIAEEGFDVPNEVMAAAKALDKCYIPTRYPNAWSEGSPHEYYTEGDGRKAIEDAKKILNWVREAWGLLKEEGKSGTQ